MEQQRKHGGQADYVEWKEEVLAQVLPIQYD